LTVTWDWTDLKPEMAACWKLVWNVEPLALSVPLSAAALEEVPAAGVDVADDAAAELDDELDEEQAAMASAAMTAPPATAACLLPRSCI
jgi:hypothetical protein